jgi:phage portal protein BeeE
MAWWNPFKLKTLAPPAPVTKAASSGGEQRIVTMLMPGGGSFNDWTANRPELAGHFRGWNYVAIHALCCEIAGLQPQVARVVDQAEQDGEVEKVLKSLHSATSTFERSLVQKAYQRKKALRTKLTRKALAHMQGGDELEPVDKDHPLIRLLRNPNGPDTSWTYFYRGTMFGRLCGVQYANIVRDRLGRPAELWPLPAHWVREKRGDKQFVDWYEVRPTGTISPETMSQWWFPGFSGTAKIRPQDMIKIAYPSPHSITDGYSPITAMGAWIDVSEAMDQSKVRSFTNGWFPGVVIEIDKDYDEPNQPEIDRVQAMVAEKYTEVRNTKKPVILGPGMKMVPNNTPVDLDYVNGGDQIKNWILAAHRTGESVVGLAENTTFASMVASRANYYQGAVKPELTLLGQMYTEKLAKEFGEDLVVYWDNPVPEDPEMELKKRVAKFAAGALSPNQWLTADGEEPWDHGGDDPFLPMGLQEMPWCTGVQDPYMQQQGAPGGGSPPAGGDLDSLMGQDDSSGGIPSPLKEEDAAEPAQSLPTPLGGDGGSEAPHTSLPTPLKKRLNGKAPTNGKH